MSTKVYSARRGPYRIIYELDEDEHLPRVTAIGHRRDVYRRRIALAPLGSHDAT